MLLSRALGLCNHRRLFLTLCTRALLHKQPAKAVSAAVAAADAAKQREAESLAIAAASFRAVEGSDGEARTAARRPVRAWSSPPPSQN